MAFSETDAVEDVFFCLDSQISGFGGSSFWFHKCFAAKGLLLGDSESGLTKSTLSNRQNKFNQSSGITFIGDEALEPIHLSLGAFRHPKARAV
jgi:hypothetical protein